MITAQDLIRKDYPKTDVQDTISELKGIFKKTKEHTALVFEGTKYMGTISKRFMLTSRINPTEMKVGNIIKKRSKAKTSFYVPILETGTDLKTICKLMTASDSHMLPVMKNKKIIGIVDIKDVLEAIAPEYTQIKIEQLSNKPICAKAKDKLDEAIDIFVRKGIDHLPITDDQNRLIGIVTLSDIIDNPNVWDVTAQKTTRASSHQKGRRSGYPSTEKTRATSVELNNFISRKMICCTPETKIPQAIKTMNDEKTCSIVIVKYDIPVGIMTAKDVLTDYAK